MGQSFDKENLEIGILSWMPFEVSDPAKCSSALLINPTLTLLVWY